MSAAVVLLIAAAALAQVPASQHVVLIIDENNSFSDVMAYMPWLVSQGNANGYATNYQSDNGGSLLDYLWLASGSCESSANCTLPPGTHNFNCDGNACFYSGTSTSDPITDDNIFRELNNAGISWKVYAQSYAAAGGTVTTPDNNNDTAYYRRHNGATWYSDILNDVAGSAEKIVDLSQLNTDISKGALPQFVIIVPDGNHDGHDCPVGMSDCTVAQTLAGADAFLNSTLTPILSTPDFQPGGDGLIIVTFDECAGGTNDGCGAAVYTALIGPQVVPHTVSNVAYKHENTLRTMLDSLGITKYPGASATAADMADFFAAGAASKPQVVVTSPAGGATLSSPVTIQASAVPTSGQTIVGWCIYVDSALAFSAGNGSTISPSISMSNGPHTIVVRAWDSSDAYGDQTFTLNVAALKPTVTVTTPANGATVGSLVTLQATAAPTAGQTIAGWWVYVDGNGVYHAGATTSINTSLTMAQGGHTVVVRAWDTSDAYGDKTFSVTVSSKLTVAISAPAANSNVISPFSLQASATPSAGHFITGWNAYLDGASVYRAGSVTSVNANITASAGAHTLVVRAWDSSGAYGDQTISFHVRTVAVNVSTPLNVSTVNSPVNIVASAVSASGIDGWAVYVDSVNEFTQSGGSSLNANVPMTSGTHTVIVRAWDTSSSAYGDVTLTITVASTP